MTTPKPSILVKEMKRDVQYTKIGVGALSAFCCERKGLPSLLILYVLVLVVVVCVTNGFSASLSIVLQLTIRLLTLL